jgi:hypothetical protein
VIIFNENGGKGKKEKRNVIRSIGDGGKLGNARDGSKDREVIHKDRIKVDPGVVLFLLSAHCWKFHTVPHFFLFSFFFCVVDYIDSLSPFKKTCKSPQFFGPAFSQASLV